MYNQGNAQHLKGRGKYLLHPQGKRLFIHFRGCCKFNIHVKTFTHFSKHVLHVMQHCGLEDPFNSFQVQG